MSLLGNQNDALEARLSVLENQSARRGPAAAAAVTTREERPLLEVVKLLPPSDTHTDRPDETSSTNAGANASNLGSASGKDADGDPPRPVIRGTGSRLETRDPALANGPKTGGRPAPDNGRLPRAAGP